ncbi:MAG: 50S ribosomal protein L18 [Planctomycetes bacterium]|nr:50S ribosomal protein L18 [Planctomycetota bacterium]
MNRNIKKAEMKARRHRRIRGKLSGNPGRPRMCVYRSHKQIYVQLIDDEAGVTLLAASSLQMELANGGGIAGAKAVGADVAKRALDKGIAQVAFDRAGYRYHGRIKALADAAREAGLKF